MNGAHADKLLATRFTLLLATVALTILGVLFVHSTTYNLDRHPDGVWDAFPSPEARGQILKAVIALVALLIVMRLDPRVFERKAYWLYTVLLLVLVGLIATKILSGGLRRFIHLRFFQVQPSELMKIALILTLARYLRFRQDQHKLHGLVVPFLLTGVPMVLVLLQPDLGTSLMLPPVLLGMLFTSGARARHLVIAVVVGLSLLPAAYFLGDRVPLIRSYQRSRLTAFVKRDEVTRRNEGFQLYQSEIAIGSGGVIGKGFGKGTQNKLGYLPERHTDFIFSVIAEELGFVGAAATVVLLLLVLLLLFRVAAWTRDPFGRLVAAGIACAFSAQVLENVGMSLGLTPITGLPLPFVSFGGSSLVTSYLAIGIVHGIARRSVLVVTTRDLRPRDQAAGGS